MILILTDLVLNRCTK